MPYARTSLRREKRKLRERMRAAGLDYRQIASELSRVYGMRPRAAWREAYGWSLQDAADNINAYKADIGLDPGGLCGMTAAHLCEHENWPGYRDTPTGRKPSPYLIAVLAGIYDCQASDLIDQADRQHLPQADLLVIDTYLRRPSPAISAADERSDIPQGSTASVNASGNYHMVLALSRDAQRIVIDITEADAGNEILASHPARRLILARE